MLHPSRYWTEMSGYVSRSQRDTCTILFMEKCSAHGYIACRFNPSFFHVPRMYSLFLVQSQVYAHTEWSTMSFGFCIGAFIVVRSWLKTSFESLDKATGSTSVKTWRRGSSETKSLTSTQNQADGSRYQWERQWLTNLQCHVACTSKFLRRWDPKFSGGAARARCKNDIRGCQTLQCFRHHYHSIARSWEEQAF